MFDKRARGYLMTERNGQRDRDLFALLGRARRLGVMAGFNNSVE